LYSKSALLEYIESQKDNGKLDSERYKQLKDTLIMKRTRTASGVTPVTVLTKPFPCPGKCIFCPNDIRMPKSYLSDEPGAQRAFRNKFDPYQQTFNRLLEYKSIGHPTDKIELIVLGGTWSAYPKDYQVWFIKRCFDAMNDFNPHIENEMKDDIKSLPYDKKVIKDFEKETKHEKQSYNVMVSKAIKEIEKEYKDITWEKLFASQKKNETSITRCIGLVIETRPDEINEEEIIRIRKLGATKVQLGVQSLNDEVLKSNKRGHTVKTTRNAFNMLRKAGFKIHIHWMPNLYGSTPDMDIKDFQKLFNEDDFKPDEMKIYPCSLIESAELYKYYKKGLWKPYTEEELLKILTNITKDTPRYCRITRMIRDIGSQDIVVGNKKTNFRQLVENKLKENNVKIVEIRSREIRNTEFDHNNIEFIDTEYETTISTEHFLEFVTTIKNGGKKLLGFLRLSLPKDKSNNFIEELNDTSMIREIHVYGPSLSIGKTAKKESQHLGLGEKLIQHAKNISKQKGFKKMSVISSIGTREYYRKKGFKDGNLYQFIET